MAQETKIDDPTRTCGEHRRTIGPRSEVEGRHWHAVRPPCGHGLFPGKSRVTNHPPSSSGLRRASESRRFSSRHTSPPGGPSISLKTNKSGTSWSTHFFSGA